MPSAGVIEGVHFVALRPAQGELSELVLTVPAGTSITDVLDASRLGQPQADQRAVAPAAIVSLWRFDPDTRKLRVTLHPPQSRPFTLLVRSQLSTGPLPAEQRWACCPSTAPQAKLACSAWPRARKCSWMR